MIHAVSINGNILIPFTTTETETEMHAETKNKMEMKVQKKLTELKQK